jgi:hypothetical protein
MSVLQDDTTEGIDKVPLGKKENEFFIVNNSENIERRQAGHKSNFWDDCGSWDRNGGATPITHFVRKNNKTVFTIKRNGVFSCENHIEKKKIFVPSTPQPNPDDIIILHRNYSVLKRDTTYKRRVSWINGGTKAVVEYIGKFPVRENHGNRKKGNRAYIRTPTEALQKMGEAAMHRNPSNVFDECVVNNSDVSAPRDIEQIKNKKYNMKKKTQERDCRNVNFADNIQTLQNMVLNNPFVRQVIHCKSRVPSVICYTEE